MNELLKVIDRFVTDMQVISGAKVAREKEDGAGLTGDKNGAIHTEDRALYTKDGAVHVHNKYGVGPSSSFAAASIVCIANRNGAAVFEGKNHNEAEGADFLRFSTVLLKIPARVTRERRHGCSVLSKLSTSPPCTVFF